MPASSKAFEDAVTYISQATTLSVPSELKLKLYALYKIAVTGCIRSSESRPAFYELTARAKWDAWQQLGAGPAVPSSEEERKAWAATQYVEEALKLGYPIAQDPGMKALASEDTAAQAPPPKRQTGGNAAVAVSQLAEEDIDDSIPLSVVHELAIDGAADKLRDYLDSYPDGIDLNALDAYGFAPLHLAADRGHAEVVRVLLDRGVDRERKDADGNSALELARLSENDGIIALLEHR